MTKGGRGAIGVVLTCAGTLTAALALAAPQHLTVTHTHAAQVTETTRLPSYDVGGLPARGADIESLADKRRFDSLPGGQASRLVETARTRASASSYLGALSTQPPATPRVSAEGNRTSTSPTESPPSGDSRAVDDPPPSQGPFEGWTRQIAAWPFPPTPPAVVFVHGGGCGAIEYTVSAEALEERMTGWDASTFHTVAYYSCDSVGEPIVNEGSSSYLPSTDDNGPNTDVRRVAYELAWYLWDNFGSVYKPVDLVGHSMGGIAIAYALQEIAAHDPDFPPHLIVPAVTTFAAPFGGVPPSVCSSSSSLECSQLTEGSSLLSQIDATGAVSVGSNTMWTLIGSDGKDDIPSSSALALPAVTNRVDYTNPLYTHTSYLFDGAIDMDADGTDNGCPFEAGDHSLALLAKLMDGRFTAFPSC